MSPGQSYPAHPRGFPSGLPRRAGCTYDTKGTSKDCHCCASCVPQSAWTRTRPRSPAIWNRRVVRPREGLRGRAGVSSVRVAVPYDRAEGLFTMLVQLLFVESGQTPSSFFQSSVTIAYQVSDDARPASSWSSSSPAHHRAWRSCVDSSRSPWPRRHLRPSRPHKQTISVSNVSSPA